MRGNGRGRILKPKFGKFEARAKVHSAAVYVLRRKPEEPTIGDLAAHELLMKLYRDLRYA